MVAERGHIFFVLFYVDPRIFLVSHKIAPLAIRLLRRFMAEASEGESPLDVVDEVMMPQTPRGY